MDGDTVKQLAERFRTPIELGGFILRPGDWQADDPVSLIKPGPSAKTLTVSTLGAVRDYVTANRDRLDLGTLVVHVVSPLSVQVLGPLSERARTREAFAAATCTDLAGEFLGRFHALEDFLIGLQVRFADVDDRKRVLQLLSNVKHETVKTALDDGVTQVVQARAGVALVSDVAVPNPVLLSGYRTFRDVPQPSSLFALRVQGGKAGELPTAGLFEADGGAWRLSSVERIRQWLADALPNVSILA